MDVIIYYNYFWYFLGLFHKSMFFFFYHGVSLTQSLKINLIVRLMISYLHLVLLGYLGGFLLSTRLIGWLLGNLFQKKAIILFEQIFILLD